MALKKCRECGKEVSSEAKSCPHCGVSTPVTPSASGCMSTILVLVIVGILAGPVSRCSDDAANSKRSAAAAAERAKVEAVLTEQITHADTFSASAAVALDDRVHTTRESMQHEALHAAANRARLDAVDALLSAGKLAAADGAVRAIHEPIDSLAKRRLVSDESRLKGFREQQVKDANAAAVKLAIGKRNAFAKELESRLLDQRMNATVSTFGEGATGLRIKWILVSKVTAHDFSKNGDFLASLRRRGFKQFKITDGYDETWTWDLTK